MLNYSLLAACISIIVGSTVYFFYWNRFIAFLLGLIFKLTLWNQGASSIWLQIGSIHFTPLAGRLLLKDVKYHSSNQTVKIVKTQISWRYWIRRTATEEDLSHARVGGEEHSGYPNRSDTCRLQISFEGFEWFLYNRTAAYDNIASAMDPNRARTQPQSFSEENIEPRRVVTKLSGYQASSTYPTAFFGANVRPPRLIRNAYRWFKQQLPSIDPKDLLPIGIDANKGVILCGNGSTPSLLVAEFRRAEGTFGIVQARSKLDLYKQVLNFKFQNAVIRYVENQECQDPMTTTGRMLHEHIEASGYAVSPKHTFLSYRNFFKIWQRLKLFRSLRFRSGSIKPTARHNSDRSPKGIEEETPLGAGAATLEYAIERKILETPILEMSYYADVVGNVPTDRHSGAIGLESFDVGNGDLPPEWGIDLVVRGGVFWYGPWADRQRAEFQRVFFPTAYHDIEPTTRLQPGDQRLWTSLKIFVELRDETMLHIPFREASKNWQWDGQVDVPRPKKREHALIHVNAGDSSTISYIIPMITGSKGYESLLEVHVDTLSVTSSLNDIKLLTSESCRVRGGLPSPLEWNGERRWTFAVSLRQPVIYILRDHINMLTDLCKDWVSGPPADYYRFIPMIYIFELEMHHFELNLYVNDSNIIDKPLVRDENAIFTIFGPKLTHKAYIPSNTYRQEATSIPFFLEVSDLSFVLSLPRWNTRASNHGNRLGNAGFFRMDASYLYFAEVHPEYVEQLKLDITIRDMAFVALGWTVRYFLVFQSNYLGSFTGFSTLYEYLEKRKRNLPVGDLLELKYREGKTNMLQVEMALNLTNGRILLPAGLPGYERVNPAQYEKPSNVGVGACIILTLPELQLQFRLHDYYMEMSVNVDTITGSIEADCPEGRFLCSEESQNAKQSLVIDRVDITANRLFGPQPRTSTYICIWEICLGHVKAILSASEGRVLAAAGNAFRINFTDMANAPASQFALPVDPDVTFLKISLKALNVTWLAGQAAIEAMLSRGMTLEMNDLASKRYRKVISLRVPQANIKVLITTSTSLQNWLETAGFSGDANVDIYLAPVGWQESARIQEEYIRAQDILTGRANFLFDKLLLQRSDPRSSHKNGLHLPQPRLSTVPVGSFTHLNQNTDDPLPSPPVEVHWRNSTQLSESEGDEVISEAGRDARLAHSRTLSPLAASHPKLDEQSMSSGDESDDDGLTEGESSESDWSDTEQTDKPRLADYHRIINHYSPSHLRNPLLWEGSPFVLTRAQNVASPRISLHRGTSPTSATLTHPVVFNPGEDHGLTVIRVQCRQSVDMRMTPLITQAASHLEADVATDPLSAELVLDGMLTQLLGDILDSKTYQRSSTIFDVHLNSISMQVFQLIPSHDHLVNASQQTVPSLNRPPVTALVGLGATGIHIKTNMFSEAPNIPSSWNVSGAIQNTWANLGIISTVGYSKPSWTADTDFDIDMSGLQFQVASDEVDLGIGNVSFDIGDSSPENLVVTGLALAESSKQLMDVKDRWTRRGQVTTQFLLYHIFMSSADKIIVDPYSTVQPSYLVQCGRPNKLRTDPIFRILHHLRRCLAEMDMSEYHLSASLSPDSATITERLLPLLDSRLLSLTLDADASNESSLLILEKLIPNLHSAGHAKSHDTKVIIAHGSFKMKGLKVLIRDPEGKYPSQYSVASMAVDVRMRAPRALQSHAITTMLSQSSLRDRDYRDVCQLLVSVSVGDASLTVFPHLLQFAQQILRAHKRYGEEVTQNMPNQTNSTPKSDAASTIYLFATISLGAFRLEAAAENLIFVFGVSALHIGSTILGKSIGGKQAFNDLSMNHSITFHEISLRARSNVPTIKRNDSDILASLSFRGGKCNGVLRQEPSSSMILRLAFSLDDLLLNVPRSAIRLYRFVEEWRGDFLPGIEATLQALLLELGGSKTKPSSSNSSRTNYKKSAILHLHTYISSLGITLQVMHGTWLSWKVLDIFAYLKPSALISRDPLQSFGIQLASQIISISYQGTKSLDAPTDTRVKLILPTVSISGRYNETSLSTLACVEHFHVDVKPSHWDTVLAVQQKFGQDFNDLVMLIEETRRKRATSVPTPERSTSAARSLRYSGFLKMRGFRIGLKGVSSTLYLECDQIGGGIKNEFGQAWNIGLSDLALSLAPRVGKGKMEPGFNRNHRSAFVIIDFQVDSGQLASFEWKVGMLRLSVTKIHAVMQPSSIGEIGDFVDHLQAELLEHKERRAAELAEFKQKTKTVMRSLEVKAGDSSPETPSAWLSNHTIDLTIRNIGVAFPLTLDDSLQLPQTGSLDSSAVRAFLFSIKSLVFGTQRGETGQAVMKGFSFQFVSQFRQSVSSDFSGETHRTRNRLLYPEMTAQLKSITSASSRNISISANVSGFILDFDSSIPDDIFSLIDVYHQGQERVIRLADSIPRSTPVSSTSPTAPHIGIDPKYTALPTSSVLASLTFLSGKVRIYSGSVSTLSRSRKLSNSARDLTDEQFVELGADIFKLPVVSVWGEYRATSAAQKFGSVREVEPSTLMFKSTVHSSQNILRPTLLPFITEVVESVEVRLRKVNLRTSKQLAVSSTQELAARAAHGHEESLSNGVSTLHISFSLRIDQSKLELTCQPDVNVIAGLHWDSGGFMVNVSPGARNVTFTGSVGGLTVGLKHGFLSEECVRLDARNLAFSLQFSKRVSDDGQLVSSVSIVLDTQFSGGVRFSRLQDVLCFKAVWLDRIPVLTGQQLQSPPKTSLALPANTPSPKQDVMTVVLVRIRDIKLDVDLGQSISAISLHLMDTFIRTKMTDELSELSLSVADVDIHAKGNISGQVTVPNCLFQTIRRRQDKVLEERDQSKMLELSLTSGPFHAVLESDCQKLLRYHAEPLEVNVFDDWSSISDMTNPEDRPLRLSFTVSGTDIIAAATVGTIPKLLSYSNMFKANMDAQQEGASRESKAFQMTRSPKPDNPLSDVANAMLNSARDRFKEAGTGLLYMIEQHLSLRLKSLRLVVFPRTMGDLEVAQFVGSIVEASLDRKVDSDGLLAKRILHLSFSSMSISKFGQLNHSLSTTADPSDGQSWLTLLLRGASEAIIVGLPSMNMVMSSDESASKELSYDFNSKFVRYEGAREFEDIYITLNMSLYSWLTVLRKNLTREMNQAQGSSDWRGNPSTVTASKKKMVEPLPLGEVKEDNSDALFSSKSLAWQQSATIPSATGIQSPAPTDSRSPLTDTSPVAESGFDEAESPVSTQPITISTPAGPSTQSTHTTGGIIYKPGERHIERLNMRQLGEATPDVMHPFFMKKAGFNLEDSLPQYVHEYATVPMEEIMQALLKLYSKRLKGSQKVELEADHGA